MRKRLFISFSGGETSAYMTHLLLNDPLLLYDEVKVVFANTGQEHEKTLEFIATCDANFGFSTTWVEAEVDPEIGKGTGFKIVSYDTASRRGEPFEDVIKKYGIPNQARPHCTRELKLQPMTAYLRSCGWKKRTYDVAIGIRADEMDRVAKDFAKNNIVYPLIESYRSSKSDVRSWWETQPFRLGIREHEGNCTWCWKKSMRKLLTLATEAPEIFDFPKRMELEYAHCGRNKDELHSRTFFRKGLSTEDVLAQSKRPFTPFVDGYRVSLDNFDADLDSAGSCSESCEVFS